MAEPPSTPPPLESSPEVPLPVDNIIYSPTTHPWEQIASEHCYPKLMAQWSSINQSLPIYHIFQNRVDSGDDGGPDSGVGSGSEGVSDNEKEEEEEEEEETVDVEYVPPSVQFPYNERKVRSIMNECTQHMNLVRLPPDNPDMLLEKALNECNYPQQVLLSKAIEIIKEGLLARLACSGSLHEPIRRRLNCDKSARNFRSILGKVKWDPQLTNWLHRSLLRVLDNDMLPVYLDVLQVLKSKCPSLIEQMVHGGPPGEGTNEALNLLLKRPWSAVVGLAPMDKQVHFDPAPLFVTIPHTTCLLGGRRWHLWQTQFSTIGKVFPVVPPDHLRESGHDVLLKESLETIFQCTMTRVLELKEQYPTRPLILVSWSTGCRIACKVAEVEKIACLINLGLPTRGIGHSWKFSSDPFVHCTTPSIFVIGEKGSTSSWQYVKELRLKMKTCTSMVLVHGADDLLRLPSKDKQEHCITQGMTDRLIQDRIYEFLVYILHCNFCVDLRLARKRKAVTEEQSTSLLSNATPNSAIVLTAHPANDDHGTMLKSLLGGGRLGNTSQSSTPSPSSLAAKMLSQSLYAFPPASKLPKIGRPPKQCRPRSKSTTSSDSKLKGKATSRHRSKSGDVPLQPTSPARSPGNSNCNNSNDASPNTLLSITQSQIPALLPVTPPKNPYENPNHVFDPRTLKQLHLH